MTYLQTSELRLVVTSGPDAGTALTLTSGVAMAIGRATDAHLVLSDPRISRRHAEVERVAEGVRVRIVPGALPIVLRGVAESEVTLAEGDEVGLAGSRLRVERSTGDSPPASAHGAATLLGSRMTEIEGFAAVFALSEALERVDSLDAFKAKVSVWARRYIPAIETAFSVSDAKATGARPLRPLEVTVKESGEGTTLVTLPATVPDRPPLLIEFTVAAGAAEVTGQLRRLLLIAVRLCALALGRIEAVDSAAQNALELRDMAVGSAKAFLGTSAAAERVAALVPRLARSETSVLIEGETGTGKSFVARLIHEASERIREPFRVLNCGAIPEALIESELFGHERGAFTGAVAPRAGAFEAAGRGTLFLDEIGELPLGSQAKLLRALEERQFERVGSTKTLSLTARVLAATNRDLLAMVNEGHFRADLYYRLSVVKLHVPALRDRGEDLVFLARHILKDLSRGFGKRTPEFTEEALEILKAYSWPGNVRELRNALEHALVLGSGSRVERCDLPFALNIDLKPRHAPEAAASPDFVQLPSSLAKLEERAIDAAMRAAGGNVTRAAGLLGIARATLYNKLNQSGALR